MQPWDIHNNPTANGITPITRPGDLTKRSSSDYSSYNGDWKSYLNDKIKEGDEAALDRMINYLMTEESSSIAREWTASREDSQYQRAVADMRAAGINPYFLLAHGANPASSSSSGNSYTGSYETTRSLGKSAIKVQLLSALLSFAGSVMGSLGRIASMR